MEIKFYLSDSTAYQLWVTPAKFLYIPGKIQFRSNSRKYETNFTKIGTVADMEFQRYSSRRERKYRPWWSLFNETRQTRSRLWAKAIYLQWTRGRSTGEKRYFAWNTIKRLAITWYSETSPDAELSRLRSHVLFIAIAFRVAQTN